MSQQQGTDALLSTYRVLDLADEKGLICGRILGDLGADVIKIEKPGGDLARSIGPFYRDIPDPEKSLFWFAFNMNKRSITLDVETSDGRQIFKRLAKAADFVIESFPPGHMDELGLGYEVLSELNPRLIMVSITPFGQTGPYKDYRASDIVGWAMGGIMYLSGDPDRPPVRVSFPQAYLHAGTQAAIGALIAHYHRETTGEGQHVDGAMQQGVSWITMDAPGYWDLLKIDLKRAGIVRERLLPGGVIRMRQVYPCRDGYVLMYVFGGLLGARPNQALDEWMVSEGISTEHLKGFGWPAFDMATITPEQYDTIAETVANFLMTHTKAELYEGAIERSIMMVPVSTIKDIVEDPQLKARDFWVEVEHPELEASITYPGPWAKFSETPLTRWQRAPLIGEHNGEVYERELGFSKEELAVLKQAKVI